MHLCSRVLPRTVTLHGIAIPYSNYMTFAAETTCKLAEREHKGILVVTNFRYDKVTYYTAL